MKPELVESPVLEVGWTPYRSWGEHHFLASSLPPPALDLSYPQLRRVSVELVASPDLEALKYKELTRLGPWVEFEGESRILWRLVGWC